MAETITGGGLAAWTGSSLGVLQGIPGWVLVIAICFLTNAMTETTASVATVLMLSPAVAAMAGEDGVHPDFHYSSPRW